MSDPARLEELTDDDRMLLLIMLGFARGAALSLKREMPITPSAELRLMRKLGVHNPEQYLTAAGLADVPDREA